MENTTKCDQIEASEAEYQQEAYRFVLAIRDEAKTFDRDDIADDEGNPSIDVRLQVYDDAGYAFHSGDSCYDTDHHGYWGYGSVSPDDDDVTCLWTARDMVSQIMTAD